MAPCWLIGTKSSFCRSRADEWRDHDSGENDANRRLEPAVFAGGPGRGAKTGRGPPERNICWI
jgi:hypothetical protein